MDVSKDTKMEFVHAVVNCFFMVLFRNLVWMGLLLLYSMALGSKRAFGTSRSKPVLHSISAVETYRYPV
jgi:hypothetical protein